VAFKIPTFLALPDINAVHSYLQTIFSRWSGSELLKIAILDIPAWNMDSTESQTVDLSSIGSSEKIMSCLPQVTNDAVTEVYLGSNGFDYLKLDLSGQTLTLYRTTGGLFDSSSFSETTSARGKVVIWYTM
jgi:hypothetical protein